MKLFTNLFKQQEQSVSDQVETYADLVGKGPRLLSGAFSRCSHSKWGYGSSSNVTDVSGTFQRVVGDCRICKEPVVSIIECVAHVQPN